MSICVMSADSDAGFSFGYGLPLVSGSGLTTANVLSDQYLGKGESDRLWN
ncbi:MAG TPA: hypothetical protein VMT76_17060 [Puia sp.]|nr:hypothetical protein [Puia sp.]